MNHHILDLDQQREELYPIFQKMRDGNTILFLGAGASVGEKKYLSKELIELYEDKIGKKIDEKDITKWIDILSADTSFKRTHFDSYVNDTLKKLTITEGHKILASIPWRQIITTNYDLLVEQAFDAIADSPDKIYELKPIKSKKEYYYRESNSEVKYIKLNGSIDDRSKYPLAFSSDDFEKLKPFYKVVLNDLRNISPDIDFISIGYSYADDFGQDLLKKFDVYNYRDKKWIIHVDPFPNMNALPYYTQNRIKIVKLSFSDFFEEFKKWETYHSETLSRRKGLCVKSCKNIRLQVSPKLLLNMEGKLRQMHPQISSGEFIKDVEFYRGQEPSFNLISRDVDVFRHAAVNEFRKNILQHIARNETLLPIFVIMGDFGIGKSTFAMRLILELQKEIDLDLLAFEIIDFNSIHKEWVVSLVNQTKAKNIVFYCDEIEIESNFKALFELRNDLSIEQFQDCNLFFIAPVRENIYEKYKLHRSLMNVIELKLKGDFSSEEIDDLLEKLKSNGLISFRDTSEKLQLKNRIIKTYESDSFISLMSLIDSGKHETDLIDCYNQLSKDAQDAFLYVALLHRFKLLMPASWLKQLVSMDWNEFTTKIINAEGKGILIQEMSPSFGTVPDLYFKTKHPLIADRLIRKFIANRDKVFDWYSKIMRTVEYSKNTSFLIHNLLKALFWSEELNKQQIDKLYDLASKNWSEDPYFLLNYTINLQYRKDITSLKKALDLLIYAESLLDTSSDGLLIHRNHKFIHRRGVINFELSKMYHKKGNGSLTFYYLNEAKDLFNIKQILDPCSSYSYVDYLNLLLWELKNCDLEEEDRIRNQIKIESLFKIAEETVTKDTDKITSIYSEYSNYILTISDDIDYMEHLEKLYQSEKTRPYACILLYNYFFDRNEEEECKRLILEMEYYLDNSEIVKFLFNYYADYLYVPDIRVKLLKLGRLNDSLEKEMPFRYNFYHFIAEIYNDNYMEGHSYLQYIKKRPYYLNPTLHYIWCDADGLDKIFNGIIVVDKSNKRKKVKILENQQYVKLKKGIYDKYTPNTRVKVKIHFYLYGLIAEIIEKKEDVMQTDYSEV